MVVTSLTTDAGAAVTGVYELAPLEPPPATLTTTSTATTTTTRPTAPQARTAPENLLGCGAGAGLPPGRGLLPPPPPAPPDSARAPVA